MVKMYHISTRVCLLLCCSTAVFASDPTKSYIELPLVQAHEASAKDITVEEFIDVSYQPVLITNALDGKTITELAPWSFGRLNGSLEAATTFCAVATVAGDATPDDTEEDRGEVEGAKIKENERIEDEIEENGTKVRKNQNEIGGKTWDIAEVSLRKFALEGRGFSDEAFVNVTRDIGKLITLPGFLESFDFDDVMRAGLHYTRRGWTSQIDKTSRSFYSASVLCMVEGRVSVSLTPFPVIRWEDLTCQGDSCTLRVDEAASHALPDQMFLVKAELGQRDCLFMPLEWMWQASASVDSVALRIIWEDDLSIRDDVLDDLLAEGEINQDVHEGPHLKEDTESNLSGRKKNRRRHSSSRTLWEVLPRGLRRTSPVLWSDENPLLHLVKFYLLSSQRRSKAQFLHDFRVDRVILPNLVDCPSECQAAAKNIFILLDADSDGILSEEDALHLTQDAFDALSSELDDLMDELRDLGVEQWETVARAGGDSEFMGRAKDRLVEGAKASMRRWVEGDMDEQEERSLKENNPSLYEDILAARERKASGTVNEGKEEL
ncbi:uncharacterized protein LOC135197140 [Macrobrachium nipponense]|uniref:uncharacterized protein LOC135197140 n=1 Tax=Macrobrachium nipponense TaxID=159736 RepID=UPI0030C87B82